ncbi:hypothetical protein [Nocardia sp. NPDC052566]|uniref:hypothetical protein n=1 Tax=Nocardia sp. NPDC052566 TaxID=3364330 RepID=UPI0037CB2F66
MREVITQPGVRPVLAVVMLWILGHNILYTYIAPFLARANLADSADIVLLIFGAAAIGGIWGTGVVVDRRLRIATLASLAGFAGAAVILGVGAESAPVVIAGVIAWGLTFGGAPTLLQTAIADAAGANADVAQSMLVTVFNLAVAGGGLLGGLLLSSVGTRALPTAALAASVLALGIVFAASHAFPLGRPGHRCLFRKISC